MGITGKKIEIDNLRMRRQMLREPTDCEHQPEKKKRQSLACDIISVETIEDLACAHQTFLHVSAFGPHIKKFLSAQGI